MAIWAQQARNGKIAAHRHTYFWHPAILSYHRITNEPNGYLMSTSPDDFARQMAWLKQHGFHVVSVTSIAEWLAGRVTLPRRTVAITFDDGYREVLEDAIPILLQHGFSATLFLVTESIGGDNDWDVKAGYPRAELLDWREIEELCRLGLTIGSHSATHIDLTTASQETLQHELVQSRQVLEQRLQMPCRLFSYPYSRADLRTARAVQDAGYLAACAGDGRSYSQYCLDRVVLSQRQPLSWWIKASGYYYFLRRWLARFGFVETAESLTA